MKNVNYFDAVLILMVGIVAVSLIGWNHSVMSFIMSKAIAVFTAWVVMVKYKQWKNLGAFNLLSSVEE